LAGRKTSGQQGLCAKPICERISAGFSQRNNPLFVAFTDDSHLSSFEVDLSLVKRHTLAHPKPAAIKQLNESPISASEGIRAGRVLTTRAAHTGRFSERIPLCEEFSLTKAEDLREPLGSLWGLNRSSGIAVVSSQLRHPVHKDAQGGQLSSSS
jgi:hypothetical protein